MFPKPNKYRAVRTQLDGIHFRSAGEADCYAQHKLRMAAHEIEIIAIEPTIRFKEFKISYKPDGHFRVCATGQERYWEHKGVLTERWRIIRKLWAAIGPAPLDLYYQKGRKSVFKETIFPARSIAN